jgi:hypothetical protein
MESLIELFAAVPLLVISYQMYGYSASGGGEERQKRCRQLGIVFMTMGIVALIFRSPVSVCTGLILMMLGFRLLAKGLDRQNKTTYIDRFDEDNK